VRDVPRTFPEHPLFTTQEGQQRLLRLLKAYAAADPEVLSWPQLTALYSMTCCGSYASASGWVVHVCA
jgi:hypothetical protein